MAKVWMNRDFSNQPGDNGTQAAAPEAFSLPPMVRFWILLVFEVPSIACSLILLYYLFSERALRQALNNHVIVALLAVGLVAKLVDIPLHLGYLRFGYVWPQIPSTCYVWWFAGTAIFNMTGLLMAWASIERHILVFHQTWTATHRSRLLVHYLPLVALFVYCFTFYVVAIFFPPCTNGFDYTQNWCGIPCYDMQRNYLMIDVITNGILPTLLIMIFNAALLARVVTQKRRLRQEMRWAKYRRMVIQLFSISALFLVFNIPFMCIILARLCGLPFGAAGQFEYYTYVMVYFITLLMPFVCLGSLPEAWTKMKRAIGMRISTGEVAPVTITMRSKTFTRPAAP